MSTPAFASDLTSDHEVGPSGAASGQPAPGEEDVAPEAASEEVPTVSLASSFTRAAIRRERRERRLLAVLAVAVMTVLLLATVAVLSVRSHAGTHGTTPAGGVVNG